MATTIPASATPLVADTLPAIKVRHYAGQPALGKLYCYGRFYLLNDDLMVSLSVFQRKANPASRAALALQCGDESLYLWLSGESCGLCTLTDGSTPQQAEMRPLLHTPIAQRFAGQDEQGWYWGAQLPLPAEVLHTHGIASLAAGFGAAVLQYQTDDTAAGSSCPCLGADASVNTSLLQQFAPQRLL